jgi:hypothetical protein
MSHTLTISDDLYTRLEATARRQGVSIEELLQRWPLSDQSAWDRELRARQEAVERSRALFAELEARYGAFPDSTDLIREDRAR